MSNFEQHLALRQKQELALKPKMLQSLKMLSLPILELESYIKQELVNNPLLELREEKDEEDIDEGNFEATQPESKVPIEDIEEVGDHCKTISEARELTEILDQWNDYHQGYEGWHGDSETDHTESLIRYEENGKEKFLEQLYPLNLPENEVEFASELIDSCDIYGFLPEGFDIEKLGRHYHLKPNRINELHQLLMHIHPQGIGARNMSECLFAQLDETQKENRIIVGLCTDQFENLIHRRYQKIASHFGVSEETVISARDQVAKLDPKPGLRILSSNAHYVFPDVTLKLIDNEYVVIINDNITPNIIISPQYRRMINRGFFDKETLQFVRDRINSAKFLIKSIYMRTRTLERVCLSIIKNQEDFFYRSSGVMVPLTYAVIAGDLSVSESTISRVVKHKYAETPFGIFALKDFFSSTAGRDDNYETISRQRVKSHIIHLVENENRRKPLSDQDLVELLKGDGLNISRRIIAKYRFELGILNSRLRRN
ncbi:MAG: RNA polymerase factor sigma-54 [Candidatus Cloacimonadaceae bacterium]|nr:RNA polymerase factor sigma-54 [Candidatus Cloacimonadaceae bacterium]MDP3114222.1 RNA polymerase factor sigma-54 [Candidatus Cloacimonadaceae bacterium]